MNKLLCVLLIIFASSCCTTSKYNIPVSRHDAAEHEYRLQTAATIAELAYDIAILKLKLYIVEHPTQKSEEEKKDYEELIKEVDTRSKLLQQLMLEYGVS